MELSCPPCCRALSSPQRCFREAGVLSETPCWEKWDSAMGKGHQQTCSQPSIGRLSPLDPADVCVYIESNMSERDFIQPLWTEEKQGLEMHLSLMIHGPWHISVDGNHQQSTIQWTNPSRIYILCQGPVYRFTISVSNYWCTFKKDVYGRYEQGLSLA